MIQIAASIIQILSAPAPAPATGVALEGATSLLPGGGQGAAMPGDAPTGEFAPMLESASGIPAQEGSDAQTDPAAADSVNAQAGLIATLLPYVQLIEAPVIPTELVPMQPVSGEGTLLEGQATDPAATTAAGALLAVPTDALMGEFDGLTELDNAPVPLTPLPEAAQDLDSLNLAGDELLGLEAAAVEEGLAASAADAALLLASASGDAQLTTQQATDAGQKTIGETGQGSSFLLNNPAAKPNVLIPNQATEVEAGKSSDQASGATEFKPITPLNPAMGGNPQDTFASALQRHSNITPQAQNEVRSQTNAATSALMDAAVNSGSQGADVGGDDSSNSSGQQLHGYTASGASLSGDPARAAAPDSTFARLVQAGQFVPLADQMMVHIRAAIKEGGQSVNIRLHPAELGRVEVRLDTASDGRTHLIFTVDNKDTLDLLQRDARGLERALSSIGLNTDAGGMSFNLRGDGQAGTQQDNGESGNRSSQDGYKTVDIEADSLSALEKEYMHVISGGYSVTMTDGLDIKV